MCKLIERFDSFPFNIVHCILQIIKLNDWREEKKNSAQQNMSFAKTNYVAKSIPPTDIDFYAKQFK